jgi:hypothetical protein
MQMKSVFALAALAAIGFAGTAYAGSATAPKAMSDSEMDKVTAGGIPDRTGQGVITAQDAGVFPVPGSNVPFSTHGIVTNGSNPPGETPFIGKCTAGLVGPLC